MIIPQRGRLIPGLVEVQLLLNVNKGQCDLDSTKLPNLGSKWSDYIPKRPDFPKDYFSEVGNDPQGTDNGDDSGDEGSNGSDDDLSGV